MINGNVQSQKPRIRFLTALVIVAATAGLLSCSKSAVDPISYDLKVSISDEATEQSVEDELDDISTSQLQVASQVSGKIQIANDPRLACAKIAMTTGDKAASGSIIINFDSTATTTQPAGCLDALGNIRKGKIRIVWNGGKWYLGGSTISVTLINYSINGVVINGTRTLTNITDPASPFIIIWTVQADQTFTWSDKTTAQRSVNKTKTWDFKEGTVTVTQGALNDAVEGTDRQGKYYTIQISNGLLYTEECIAANKIFIPVAGTQILTFDTNTVLTFDYGSNSCDDTFTVTYNGKTESFTATNTGN